MKYAGSDWIEHSLKVSNMSTVGKAAADLLGDVFLGIYHLNTQALKKVDWANNYGITFILDWHSLSTVDNNELTRLVVLGHDRMLRVSIEPYAFRYLIIRIHQRTTRDPNAHLSQRYPTLEEHIKMIRNHYNSQPL